MRRCLKLFQRGVYFGSEWSTSEGYCQSGPDGSGCMLVQRVALGKVQVQTQIDGSIVGPKKGFDSIHGDPTVSCLLLIFLFVF